MKTYISPTVDICRLLPREELAAVVMSEPTVEDNEDDLSV